MFMHRLPAMWQKCLELATQGSPEHIKLIALRTGELHQDAANGRGPGIARVFINVPRPPRELEDTIDEPMVIRSVFPSDQEQ
jgi:hypothetical protein